MELDRTSRRRLRWVEQKQTPLGCYDTGRECLGKLLLEYLLKVDPRGTIEAMRTVSKQKLS
jgi:hypothetical protein